MLNNNLDRFSGISLEEIYDVKLMNRIDVKYVFMSAQLPELLRSLPSNYRVFEIDSKRLLPYSTTYYDTEDFLFYYQHLHGKLNRHKIRCRTYDTTGETFLEVKKKTNKGRTVKWRIHNNPSENGFDTDAKNFLNKYVPPGLPEISPVLRNSFIRITLADNCLMERITIDFNISFSDPSGKCLIHLPHLAVAELKKEAAAVYSPFRSIARELKIYPSGFSKYCIGAAMINKSLKMNTLKPKILLLNKFENEYFRSAVTY